MTTRKRITLLLLVVLVAAAVVPTAVASELTEEEQLEQAFMDLFGSIHMVVLTDDFRGEILAADGEDYTFEVNDDSFDYQILAYMDGDPVNAVDNGDGTYTIRNVTGSLVIGGRKTAKLPQMPAEAPSANSGAVVMPQEPVVQPAPVSDAPVEPAPEIVPQESAEDPVVEQEVPVQEPAEKPTQTAEPVPAATAEQEPFPWWIMALALLGVMGTAALGLLLSRRTVSFVVEGGTTVPAQKILKGRMASRPREPEKDGAVFAGWFVDEARTQRWNFENAKVENHMVLYAKWLAA